MRKRGNGILFIILSLLLVFGGLAKASDLNFHRTQPLTIGIDVDYPPLQYLDEKGAPQGYDVKLTTEIMKRLDIPYTFHAMPWNEVSQMMTKGQVDLYMAVYSDRHKGKLYYSDPVMRVYYQIVYRNDSDRVIGLRNIRGKRVAFMKSAPLIDTLSALGARQYIVTDLCQAFVDLDKGKYDAVICFGFQTAYMLKKSKVSNVVSEFMAMTPREYCYVSNNAQLITAINYELKNMRRDGDINRIYGYELIPLFGLWELPVYVLYVIGSLTIILLSLIVISRYYHLKYKRSDLLLVQSGMSIAEGLCLYDADGYLISMNEAAQQMLGIRDLKSYLKERPNVFTHPWLSEYVRRGSRVKESVLLRCSDDMFVGRDVVVRRYYHFPKPISIRVSFNAMMVNKHLRGYVATVSDVTEFIDVQNRLEKERNRAQRSEHLKTVFLSNVSHALRTPLNAILGFSDILGMSDDLQISQEERKNLLDMINSNGHQLLYFINELLQLSTIEGSGLALNLVTVEIHDLFQGFEEEIAPKLHDQVTFVCDSPVLSHQVTVDIMVIKEIVSHLLDNAAKNTDRGTVTLSYRVENKGLRVDVIDTGRGVSEKLKASIFNLLSNKDTYVQDRTPGLGLSICHAIISACSGEMNVESEEGKGAHFWFWVPCHIIELKPADKTS